MSGRWDDPLDEAPRLISAAGAELQALLGGLAFHATVPAWTTFMNREGRDIDLATRSRDKRAVASLPTAEGNEPDKGYNAVHGYKQLYFADPDNGQPIDVLIGRPDMCHEVPFPEPAISRLSGRCRSQSYCNRSCSRQDQQGDMR